MRERQMLIRSLSGKLRYRMKLPVADRSRTCDKSAIVKTLYERYYLICTTRCGEHKLIKKRDEVSHPEGKAEVV
jgi:hypothetical protein